jgi:hypothetical protein
MELPRSAHKALLDAPSTEFNFQARSAAVHRRLTHAKVVRRRCSPIWLVHRTLPLRDDGTSRAPA